MSCVIWPSVYFFFRFPIIRVTYLFYIALGNHDFTASFTGLDVRSGEDLWGVRGQWISHSD